MGAKKNYITDHEFLADSVLEKEIKKMKYSWLT